MSDSIFFIILLIYLLGVIGASMLFSFVDDSKDDRLLRLIFSFLWPVVVPLLGVLATMYAISGQFRRAR